MKISSYKELEAYKKSYELVKLVYEFTKAFPKEETYGLTAQIRRASVSIPSNIAEGYMRGSKEYVHHLRIALGSCAELETQISLSRDLCFCGSEEANQAINLNTETMKLLTTYINRIGSRF